MKKRAAVHLAILFFPLSLLLIHCQNDGGKDFHLAGVDAILTEYNHNQPEWDKAVKVEDIVNISAAKGLISVEFKTDSNEVITYFLQTENNETPSITQGSFKAEILYLNRYLIVNSLAQKATYYFKIKPDKKPAYLEDLKNVKEYAGYGLGMRKIAPGYTSENAPYCKCVGAGTEAALCSSGGDGSLACSTGNPNGICKIVCSGQTMSCCKNQ